MNFDPKTSAPMLIIPSMFTFMNYTHQKGRLLKQNCWLSKTKLIFHTQCEHWSSRNIINKQNETQEALCKVYNDNRLLPIEEYFQMFSQATTVS